LFGRDGEDKTKSIRKADKKTVNTAMGYGGIKRVEGLRLRFAPRRVKDVGGRKGIGSFLRAPGFRLLCRLFVPLGDTPEGGKGRTGLWLGARLKRLRNGAKGLNYGIIVSVRAFTRRPEPDVFPPDVAAVQSTRRPGSL